MDKKAVRTFQPIVLSIPVTITKGMIKDVLDNAISTATGSFDDDGMEAVEKMSRSKILELLSDEEIGDAIASHVAESFGNAETVYDFFADNFTEASDDLAEILEDRLKDLPIVKELADKVRSRREQDEREALELQAQRYGFKLVPIN